MKSILVLCLLVSIFGCKIVSCPVAETIATGASAAIAKAADCANPQAIHDDILAFLDKDGTCRKPVESGPIAFIACPILSRLVTNAVWKKVPAKWECDGGMAKEAIVFTLTAGCNLIPF